ncbi:MAG: tRNA uridine(34) 5-carboxymethylaminomethyl modification radical SAM/GNAT enzyme Elp3 [Candidatus Aenigmarchaeota archaeon]|nr:tRNA uridine(34) 5-carboxymethylaminomethyl modification radical SAM/GNAT enzyme Elp3 [Candidatus Aenigmarchaeota archaeon]
MSKEKVAKEVLRRIKEDNISKEEIQKLKTKLASKYGIEIPGNEFILSKAEDRKSVLKKLQRKPSRTLSGVSIVAVMTSPQECPHGTCVYCPKNPDVPQSYADNEPAVMRGLRLNFDPYKQTQTRLRQLEIIGHPTDKVELIIMGGTFTGRDVPYQENFVKRCFDAMNGKESKTLEEAKTKNEKAKHRCVGLTIETRPDYMKMGDINRILDYGATRVELGVQNPDDMIYREMKRGHYVRDVVESTRLLKDSGFKVCYHLMPNLPGSDLEKDLKMFRVIFDNPDYRPDMLKIYPTLVLKNSELEKLWRKGEYEPYSDKELIDLLCRIKKELPPYVRIMRLQRDVPVQEIVAGCKNSNLRQIVQEEMKKRKWECNCIRCREAGHKKSAGDFEFRKLEYEASCGREFFLSYENDALAGILRLRFPFKPFRPELKNSAIVRELHVYGAEAPLGEKGKVQHKGYGGKLLKKAEKLSRSMGMKKIAVISGVGVREYYRKKGYILEGTYMCKKLI